MKTSGKICLVIILLIAGVLIGIALPIKWHVGSAEVALFPFNEHVWNQVFDVINAALLLATLVTAIFKEQILDRIYCARFEIDKTDDYRENVENTEVGLRANAYEKIMSVQNAGNRPAKNCKLVIDNISIKCESDYCETEVDVNETVILPNLCKLSDNQLRPQGSLSFSMFRVLPKITAHDNIPERPMLFQIGDNEIEIKQGKTDYIIAFHVEAEEVQSPTFKIVVHWNGKWQNRKTEMAKMLSVEYLS